MKLSKGELQRYRNSRGFGVHSPFGYEFVRNVVRIGSNYSYYAEKDIRKAGRSFKVSEEEISHAIRLHRLAVVLKIENVLYSNGMTDLKRIALRHAGSTLYPFSSQTLGKTSGTRTLFLGNDGDLSEQNIPGLLGHENNTVLIYSQFPESTSKELMSHTESGIIFEGFKCAISICRSQTQPNLYKITF